MGGCGRRLGWWRRVRRGWCWGRGGGGCGAGTPCGSWVVRVGRRGIGVEGVGARSSCRGVGGWYCSAGCEVARCMSIGPL
jgi:hypothetical protein